MHATLMAIAPPKPPAQDFLIEVLCEEGEEEPSYKRVVAAVRKMCNKSDDAQIAIGIDASTILSAHGGTFSAVRRPLPTHRDADRPPQLARFKPDVASGLRTNETLKHRDGYAILTLRAATKFAQSLYNVVAGVARGSKDSGTAFARPFLKFAAVGSLDWLPPYKLEVAPGIFVTLRDKAIRDPFDGATRVVTVRVSSA